MIQTIVYIIISTRMMQKLMSRKHIDLDFLLSNSVPCIVGYWIHSTVVDYFEKQNMY